MSDLTDYIKVLTEAINMRRDWLEKSELPSLKDNVRIFQSSYTALYNAFLKKGLINEDPYKQEAKLGEIQSPPTDAFPENEKMEKISIRFADFDNQLDFLVNFYQFSTDFLNLDRIKRILSLIKFIDWMHLHSDSSSINTRYAALFVNQMKIGLDPLSLSIVNESQSNLQRMSTSIVSYLKILTDFNKETYKLDVRTAITSQLPEVSVPTTELIKKKFPQSLPGKPFYPDLVEDVIKEDYSSAGPKLREAVLKSLKVEAKTAKKESESVSFKHILIDGIQSLGSVANILVEVGLKLDENENLLAHKKLTLGQKIKRLINAILNKEPEAIIYDLQYIDQATGNPTRDRVNFNELRASIDRRVKNLSQIGASRGSAAAKLEVLEETKLIAFLELNIRDLQSLHKTLTALDEYFKANVDKDDRPRVKGIKPELSTIKNAFIRANQKRYDYNAQKEESEQFKKMGITVNGE